MQHVRSSQGRSQGGGGGLGGLKHPLGSGDRPLEMSKFEVFLLGSGSGRGERIKFQMSTPFGPVLATPLAPVTSALLLH